MKNEKLNKEWRATIELMVADGIISQECAEKYFPELKESEDEKIRRWIINEIKIKHHNLDEDNVDFVDKAIAWLERQVEQKPAWSEEDETRLINIIIMLKEGSSLHFNKKDITKAVDWLKALKERYAYKPTDEQIDALRYVVNHYTPAVYDKLAWDALNTTQLMFGQLVKL